MPKLDRDSASFPRAEATIVFIGGSLTSSWLEPQGAPRALKGLWNCLSVGDYEWLILVTSENDAWTIT